MYCCGPPLGRAVRCYLSTGGNHKTKAIGRNSELKRLDSIYAFGLIWLALRFTSAGHRKILRDLFGSS